MARCLRLHLAEWFFRGQLPDEAPQVPDLDGFAILQPLGGFAERIRVVDALHHLRWFPDMAVQIYDVEANEKHAAPKREEMSVLRRKTLGAVRSQTPCASYS